MKGKTQYYVLILMLVALYFFATYIEMQIIEEYLVLLPSLFIVVFSLFGVKSSRGGARVGAWLFVGVGFALMADALNTAGEWVPTLLVDTGVSLGMFQALLCVGGLVVGLVTQ